MLFSIIGRITYVNDHYFSNQPKVSSDRKIIEVQLVGNTYSLLTDNGVFSTSKIDLGTSVLLSKAPLPPENGLFLDAGCGWGPIALSLALHSPNAKVFAVDINERSVNLTKDNAQRLKITNIDTFCADEALEIFRTKNIKFDLIWSNPPIRIGKNLFQNFLITYLSLLSNTGVAYLVIQKNLGADSCIKWLNSEGYLAQKFASQKGYRIVEVKKKN